MKDSRLIILREEGKILSLLLTEGRLIEASSCAEQEAGGEDCSLGSIYVGKVTNVAANIDAAFVELIKGVRGFLPLSRGRVIEPLNRPGDGRLLAGDEILVQVEREAVKTKDPVLTTEISLSGRYAVVIPERGKGTLRFSGKLPSGRRKSIGTMLEERGICDAVLSSCSVIVRTNAGELEDAAPLAEEITALAKTAEHLILASGSRTCHSCLYRPESVWLREIRDTYFSQYDEIVTDDEEIYRMLKDYLEAGYPEGPGGLRLYEDDRVSLRHLYGIDAKLQEALGKRVWLRSGGYLVIEPTEALTVIDVNSGKYSRGRKAGDTFRLINQEAAREIARQLRLRNLSGIILVDFINMETREEEKELLALLAAELKKDPVKASVVDMTPLGLVEITRKKIRKSLREQFYGGPDLVDKS